MVHPRPCQNLCQQDDSEWGMAMSERPSICLEGWALSHTASTEPLRKEAAWWLLSTSWPMIQSVTPEILNAHKTCTTLEMEWTPTWQYCAYYTSLSREQYSGLHGKDIRKSTLEDLCLGLFRSYPMCLSLAGSDLNHFCCNNIVIIRLSWVLWFILVNYLIWRVVLF